MLTCKCHIRDEPRAFDLPWDCLMGWTPDTLEDTIGMSPVLVLCYYVDHRDEPRTCTTLVGWPSGWAPYLCCAINLITVGSIDLGCQRADTLEHIVYLCGLTWGLILWFGSLIGCMGWFDDWFDGLVIVVEQYSWLRGTLWSSQNDKYYIYIYV